MNTRLVKYLTGSRNPPPELDMCVLCRDAMVPCTEIDLNCKHRPVVHRVCFADYVENQRSGSSPCLVCGRSEHVFDDLIYTREHREMLRVFRDSGTIVPEDARVVAKRAEFVAGWLAVVKEDISPRFVLRASFGDERIARLIARIFYARLVMRLDEARVEDMRGATLEELVMRMYNALASKPKSTIGVTALANMFEDLAEMHAEYAAAEDGEPWQFGHVNLAWLKVWDPEDYSPAV